MTVITSNSGNVKQNAKYEIGSNSRIANLLFRRYPFIFGLFLRVVLCLLFPALFDHGVGVQYTDIDYYVFTDAARLVQAGQSPYRRHTYRYTPFLASLLALSGNSLMISSRILFCFADALCGYIILKLRVASRMRCSSSTRLTAGKDGSAAPIILPSDSLWWLYNPLAINICTRGSAESLVVLLPVLLCVAVATWYPSSTNSRRKRDISSQLTMIRREHAPAFAQPMICGILLGTAIHLKIYPIIYTLSFMIYFSRQEDASCWQLSLSGAPKSCNTYRDKLNFIVSFVSVWIRRLLRPPSMLLFVFAVGSFTALTLLAVKMYGLEAWDQGIAYHISRVDHRHNYSVYWYWIYLLRAKAKQTIDADNIVSTTTDIFGIWSHILFLPQITLLLVSSMLMAPIHLELTLFCQTFLFVSCNKVITGQYFTWYLALLPLCITNDIDWMKRQKSLVSFAIFGLTIIIWLASAYCLEMLGWPMHLQVWIAGLLFFVANVNIFGVIVDGCHNTCNDDYPALKIADRNAAEQKKSA